MPKVERGPMGGAQQFEKVSKVEDAVAGRGQIEYAQRVAGQMQRQQFQSAQGVWGTLRQCRYVARQGLYQHRRRAGFASGATCSGAVGAMDDGVVTQRPAKEKLCFETQTVKSLTVRRVDTCDRLKPDERETITQKHDNHHMSETT